MTSHAWVRRKLDELCNHLDGTLGSSQLSDLIPEPLNYGQVADEGVSDKLSRSDHRHALSAAIIGNIPSFMWDVKSGTGGAGVTRYLKLLQETPGVNNTNAPDDPGVTGAFGVDRISFGAILVNNTGHIVMAQDTANAGAGAGNTTDRNHSVARLSRFIMRIRALTTATPAGNHTLIGGFHETVNQDFTTLDDSLGFQIQVDGAGVGNFHAVARSSTTGLTTDVDLGIGWDSNNYMKFLIDYDGTFADFVINDVLLATISSNIPDQKLFGWGMTTRKEAGTNFTELMMDTLIFLGRF